MTDFQSSITFKNIKIEWVIIFENLSQVANFQNAYSSKIYI